MTGFRAWLELGYCVRRGERSHIRVWARCEPSRTRLQAWRDAGADTTSKPSRSTGSKPYSTRYLVIGEAA